MQTKKIKQNVSWKGTRLTKKEPVTESSILTECESNSLISIPILSGDNRKAMT